MAWGCACTFLAHPRAAWASQGSFACAHSPVQPHDRAFGPASPLVVAQEALAPPIGGVQSEVWVDEFGEADESSHAERSAPAFLREQGVAK